MHKGKRCIPPCASRSSQPFTLIRVSASVRSPRYRRSLRVSTRFMTSIRVKKGCKVLTYEKAFYHVEIVNSHGTEMYASIRCTAVRRHAGLVCDERRGSTQDTHARRAAKHAVAWYDPNGQRVPVQDRSRRCRFAPSLLRLDHEDYGRLARRYRPATGSRPTRA